jgi:predicted AAA+ superfamily ATPase
MFAIFSLTTPGGLRAGLPANNVLLWGARGMGKSSLVKSVHAELSNDPSLSAPLKLIEIHREDINSLPGVDERSWPASSGALHPVL